MLCAKQICWFRLANKDLANILGRLHLHFGDGDLIIREIDGEGVGWSCCGRERERES